MESHLEGYLEDTGGIGAGVAVFRSFPDAEAAFLGDRRRAPELGAHTVDAEKLEIVFHSGRLSYRCVVPGVRRIPFSRWARVRRWFRSRVLRRFVISDQTHEAYKFFGREYRWIWISSACDDFTRSYMFTRLRSTAGVDLFMNRNNVSQSGPIVYHSFDWGYAHGS